MRARAKDDVAALQRQTASRGLVVGKEGTTDWQNANELALGMILPVVVGERIVAESYCNAASSPRCSLRYSSSWPS